jgi:hypothetical protein
MVDRPRYPQPPPDISYRLGGPELQGRSLLDVRYIEAFNGRSVRWLMIRFFAT